MEVELQLRLPKPIARIVRYVGNDCVVCALRQAVNYHEAERIAGIDDVECFHRLLENCVLMEAADSYLEAREWLRSSIRQDPINWGRNIAKESSK